MGDKKLRVGFLITARMKSTRLPKKITLKINNKEIIRYMIERIKKAQVLDEIIIATSVDRQDDILETIAAEENIKCFRGSEDDVLDRLYNAAKKYKIDYILNVTADCPLVSTEYFEKIVEEYKKTDADLIKLPDLPVGLFSYGIKIKALKKILKIKASSDTEVWGRYFTDTKHFKVVDLETHESHKQDGLRCTLDYKEDFEFLERVYKDFDYNVMNMGIDNLLMYFRKNTEIMKINIGCEELYKQRWNQQNILKLKGIKKVT